MKKFLKPILAILIFLFMQVVGTAVAAIYAVVMNPDLETTVKNGDVMPVVQAQILTPGVMSLSLIVSGLLTAICLYLTNLVDRKTVFSSSVINWKWAPVVIVAAFAGIFATDLMSEWFDLPNLLEEQFLDLSHSFVGIISLAVIGPVAEELTFREAFIGNLLKDKVNSWLAIFLSALCFGLIHGNPAQIPFAIIIGFILGLVYYKTGNIVLTTIIHILNNSVAVLEMNLLGDQVDTFTYRDALGWMDIPFIIILALLCIFALYRFYLSYRKI